MGVWHAKAPRPRHIVAALCCAAVVGGLLLCVGSMLGIDLFETKTDRAAHNITTCARVQLPPGSRVLAAQTDEPSFNGDFSGNLTADIPSQAVEKMRADARLPEFAPGLPPWLTIADIAQHWQHWHDPDMAKLTDAATFRYAVEGEDKAEPRGLFVRTIDAGTTRIYLSITCF